MVIRWLGEDECHDAGIAGGKAARLSVLATSASYRVPAGFVVPSMSPTGSVLSSELVEEIATAYGALGDRCGRAEPAVAVRSSAIDEDGVGASFAGQHDTYLNIRGRERVLDAASRCIRSAASDEAMAYRRQRGLSDDDVRIAVLVQELVAADVSAVAFSAHPVTGNRDEVVITSNWGLGECIVGGSATPDTFVVRKRGLEVVERAVARKLRISVLTEDGTSEVAMPAELQEKASLDDAEVEAIARMAIELEDHAGNAVDVECAIADGVLYLLQCRPITTLG